MFILSSLGFLREWMFAISTIGIQNQNKTEQDRRDIANASLMQYWLERIKECHQKDLMPEKRLTAIFIFIFFYTKVNFIYLDNSQ